MNRSIAARLLGLAFAGVLAVGCTTAAGSSVAPSATVLTVQQQITATSDGLDAALAAYKAGDGAKAEELVSDAYLEHYEFVEGPLELKDKELMHGIEQLIREQVRGAIRAGKTAAEVEALVTEAKADLATAAMKLE